MCYGSALFIFATVLFLRTITNAAIPHPANRVGEVCTHDISLFLRLFPSHRIHLCHSNLLLVPSILFLFPVFYIFPIYFSQYTVAAGDCLFRDGHVVCGIFGCVDGARSDGTGNGTQGITLTPSPLFPSILSISSLLPCTLSPPFYFLLPPSPFSFLLPFYFPPSSTNYPLIVNQSFHTPSF